MGFILLDIPFRILFEHFVLCIFINVIWSSKLKNYCRDCVQHGFLWLFQSIHPYHPLLTAGPSNYFQCPHRTDVISCWSTNTGTLIEECCLWVCPCFSNSALHVLFVLLGWFVRLEINGHTAAVLWGAASRICSKQPIAFLGSSHLAFSACILLASILLYRY